MKKNNTFLPPYLSKINIVDKKVSSSKKEIFFSVKKYQSNKVKAENFHRPISKIIDFDKF